MRHKAKFIGILLIIVLALGACTPSSTTLITTTTTTTPASTGNEKVKIVSHSMGLTETGLPMVTGTLENTTSIFLSIIEVWVKFYDASGMLLGTSSDLTNNDLGPGERWIFLNVYFGPNPENVKSYIVEIGTPN